MLVPKQKPKVIIFDVDETLTDRITWYELTERLGGSAYKHADLYMKFLNGQISYQAVKKELFKIWKTNGPIHKDKLIKIFQNIHIKGEATSLINNLQQRGYELCLISGSIDMFIKILAKKFRIQYAYGNAQFYFDNNGYWSDFEYTKEENLLKLEQLHDFLKKSGFKKEECIAVGDGDNDSELFRTIPGIVVNSQSEHLKELAWQSVKYLPKILQILETLE